MSMAMKKSFVRAASALVVAGAVSGCATTNIVVAPNDLCQVEAFNDKGEVIGSQHSQECHDAKMAEIKAGLKAEVLKANVAVQQTAQQQNLAVQATAQKEALATAALAGRVLISSGDVSPENYLTVLRPLIRTAAQGEEGRQQLLQAGFDVQYMQALEDMQKVENAYDKKLCWAKSTEGQQAVNPEQVAIDEGLANVAWVYTQFAGHVDLPNAPLVDYDVCMQERWEHHHPEARETVVPQPQ